MVLRKLTGEELGRLIIKNTIVTYKQTLEDKNLKPIFSQEELDEMVESVDLTETRNRDMYNRYVYLNDWTRKYRSISNTIYADAMSVLKTLLIYVNSMLLVQEALLAYSRIPLVEEKKEFEKNTKRLVLEKTDEQASFTLIELFPQVIRFSKSDKINKLLEKYKQEKPKSRYVKENYGKVTGNEDNEGLEELTKYNIVNDIFIFQMYPDLFFSGQKNQELIEYEVEAFKEDFSELIELVLEEVENTLKLEKLDFDRDINKEILSCDEALKNNYWDTERLLENLAYRDNEHYLSSGVAFYKYSKPVISDFAENKFKQLDEEFGFLSIMKNNGENIKFKNIKESIKNVKKYYQELIAYDRTIEVIAESLEIPDYKVFKLGAEDIYNAYKAIKDSISSIEETVKLTYYANPSQVKTRLEALETAFKDFDLEGYKVPEKEQKELEMELKADLKTFKDYGSVAGEGLKLFQRLMPVKEGVEDD